MNTTRYVDLNLAVLSQAAYLGVDAFDENQNNSFITKEINNIKTGTTAYLSVDNQKMMTVLSFRGTEDSSRDIKTDIDFFKDDYKNYRVHSGFLEAYLSVKADLDNELLSVPGHYSFYITGHSLGGALACLAALDYRHTALVTFGQPRVGNKKTSRALNKLNYRRFVNHADAVPRAPRINYYHGGKLFYLTEDGKCMVNPSTWFMFKERFLSFTHRVNDHDIIEYIKKLSFIPNEDKQ